MRTLVLASAFLLTAGALPTGAVEPPALSADPPTVDLGTLERNARFSGYIYVRNDSSQTVNIGGISLTDPRNFIHTAENGCRGPLLPGATCPIRYGGRVGGVNDYVATFKLFSDDPRSPLVVKVRAVVPDASPPAITHGPQHQEMVRAYLPPQRLARYRWSWSGKDDQRITGFRTQMRVGKGAWKTIVRPGAGSGEPLDPDESSQSRRITVPAGKRVTIRTRAYDPAGNASPWASRSVKVLYRDIRLGSSLSGPWTKKKAQGTAFGDSVVVARRRGATASITVRARAIALVGRKGPRNGSLKTEHEGGDVEAFGSHADASRDLQVLYSWSWEDVAVRTVTVTTTSGWQRPVVLDAWVVME